MNTITIINGKIKTDFDGRFVTMLASQPVGKLYDYTLLDLLYDWINLFGNKIDRKITVAEYINALQQSREITAIMFGNQIITISEKSASIADIMMKG